MKKVFVAMMALVMVVSIGVSHVSAAEKQDIPVYVNGGKGESAFGEMKDDRVFIPLRAVAEALDCKVDWDDKTKTVTIDCEGYIITHTIGTTYVTHPFGEKGDIGVASYLNDEDRTMVSIRLFAEALGYNVEWSSEYRMVMIQTDVAG